MTQLHSGFWRVFQGLVRSLSAELRGVFLFQSLPAFELHGVRAGDAPNGMAGEQPMERVESDMPTRRAPGDEPAIDGMPERETRSVLNGCEFPSNFAEFEQLGIVGARNFGFDGNRV